MPTICADVIAKTRNSRESSRQSGSSERLSSAKYKDCVYHIITFPLLLCLLALQVWAHTALTVKGFQKKRKGGGRRKKEETVRQKKKRWNQSIQRRADCEAAVEFHRPRSFSQSKHRRKVFCQDSWTGLWWMDGNISETIFLLLLSL